MQASLSSRTPLFHRAYGAEPKHCSGHPAGGRCRQSSDGGRPRRREGTPSSHSADARKRGDPGSPISSCHRHAAQQWVRQGYMGGRRSSVEAEVGNAVRRLLVSVDSTARACQVLLWGGWGASRGPYPPSALLNKHWLACVRKSRQRARWSVGATCDETRSSNL